MGRDPQKVDSLCHSFLPLCFPRKFFPCPLLKSFIRFLLGIFFWWHVHFCVIFKKGFFFFPQLFPLFFSFVLIFSRVPCPSTLSYQVCPPFRRIWFCVELGPRTDPFESSLFFFFFVPSLLGDLLFTNRWALPFGEIFFLRLIFSVLSTFLLTLFFLFPFFSQSGFCEVRSPPIIRISQAEWCLLIGLLPSTYC